MEAGILGDAGFFLQILNENLRQKVDFAAFCLDTKNISGCNLYGGKFSVFKFKSAIRICFNDKFSHSYLQSLSGT